MHKTVVSVLFVLASSVVGGAQQTSAKEELMQLERQWSAAYLQHDTVAITRILADDFVGIDGRGIVTTKADEIAEARSLPPDAPPPAFTVLDESVTDMKVRFYGASAVVNGRVHETFRSRDGREGRLEYRRTTVWVRRERSWKCVSFHGSRIIDPAAGEVRRASVQIASSSSDPQTEAMRVLVRQAEAGVHRDVSVIGELLDPEYFHTNPDGSVMTRVETLESYQKPKQFTLSAEEFEDTKMIVVSKESVIVNVGVVLKGKRGEDPFTSRYRVTYVLRKADNTWKVLNSHSSLLSVAPGD